MISSDFEKNLQPTTVTVQRKPISPECTYSPTNSICDESDDQGDCRGISPLT